MELDPREAVLLVRERILPLRQAARRLEAEGVGEPAGRGGGPRVVEGECYPRKIVRFVRHCVALLHPGAEPRRRHGDERRAAAFFSALRNCRLEPDGRPCCGWLEAHVDRHVVERAFPGQALARLPHRDSSQLEPVTALGVVHLHDSATDTGLAAHLDEPARVEGVDRPSHPPEVELVGEGREGREGSAATSTVEERERLSLIVRLFFDVSLERCELLLACGVQLVEPLPHGSDRPPAAARTPSSAHRRPDARRRRFPPSAGRVGDGSSLAPRCRQRRQLPARRGPSLSS